MPPSPVSTRADARPESQPPELEWCKRFWERLSEQVGPAIDAGHPFSLLVLEPNGDCPCLRNLVAALVASHGGPRAAAFRLAGHRLAVLLPWTPLASALSLARLLELRLAFHSEGEASVSIGVATLDGQTDSPEELFARAHLAMLEAKRLAAATVAFGHSFQRPAPSNAAGTARLVADLMAFDRLLDTRPRAAAQEPVASRGAGSRQQVGTGRSQILCRGEAS
jgi:Diguanylate cyclase, GGDEF domain